MVSVLGLAAAVVLLGLTAILAAASLRLPAITGFVLAVYVLAAGEIIALTELLSLFHWVGARGYLVGELALLVLALAVWSRRGRPLPSLPSVRLRAVREHPALGLLALAVGAAVCYQAFLVLATPPNTWDSLAYHLARAAEWYQRGAVEYYPTHSTNLNATQPNAEMLTLYTFAFAGRDTVAAAPQLFAELASLVAVYGMAIRLGFPRAAAASAALLTGTISLVVLESVTTQNDLLAASFLATTVYFLFGRVTPDLALAGLALGLAVGTKLTAVVGLPVVVLAAVLVLDRRHLLRGAAFACAGFALVGAYGYVLNVVHTGRPLGDASSLGSLRPSERTFSGTASTVARFGYNFVDLSGYPVSGEVTRPLEAAGERLFSVARIPVNPASSTILEPPVPSPFTFGINTEADETRSYYGPLGALVLLPLSVGFLIAIALGRAPPLLLVPALAIPAYIVGVALSSRYHEYAGRYLLPGIVLAMPIMAWLYRRRSLAAVIAGVGLLTLALAHIQNTYKPTGIDGRPPIWSLTRTESQSAYWPDMARVIEGVEQNVPSEGRLGYVLSFNDWIYPFYGPDLTRRLVKLPRDGVFAAAEREDLEAIIATGRVAAAPGWKAIHFPTVQWTLLLR